MAEPVWQELLRLRLAERNAKESAFAPVIEQCTCTLFCLVLPIEIAHSSRYLQDRRLAQQTKLLKERNASLLRAVATVKQNPSSSTVFVPGTNEECVPRSDKHLTSLTSAFLMYVLQEPRQTGLYYFS